MANQDMSMVDAKERWRPGPPSLLSIRLINRTSCLWFASQGDVNREVSLHKDPILKVKG